MSRSAADRSARTLADSAGRSAPPASPASPSPPPSPAPHAAHAAREVKPEGQWHHGNLRESLIYWGTHLLDTRGIEAMSMRAAAKLAGVTQAAPAHHFGDKNGLLAAIAAQAFRDLTALRLKRLEAVEPGDVRGRLRAVMRAYLEFAQAHPARFHLMHSPLIAHPERYPELVEAGISSYTLLRSAVQPLLPPGRAEGLSDDDLAFAVWASAHGLATLRLNRRAVPVPGGPRSTEAMCDAVVRFCLLALDAAASSR